MIPVPAGMDVDATAALAQIVLAGASLWAVWKVSRVELDAQRAAASEAKAEFGALLVGITEDAARDIELAATLLTDDNTVKSIAHGYGNVPNTTPHVNLLKALDYNRMPTASVARAVAETRRLAGWTKNYRADALDSFRDHGAVHPDLVESIMRWGVEARAAADTVRAGVKGLT